jgi:type I restriction-modification system DNA methylase subunit
VFENLLATYNPETGKQARKATGSFYTPREIVSYMVDESLKQHLISCSLRVFSPSTNKVSIWLLVKSV